MALAKTALAAAAAVNDTVVTVASAAGIAAGMLWRCDGESGKVGQNYISGSVSVPVLRGLDGSATSAHKLTADIVFGLGSDFAAPLPQATTTYPRGFNLPIYGYSASGAIAPVAGVHVLYGTTVLNMTIAAPTQDQTGDVLIVINSGNAVHLVTVTGGMGGVGGAADIVTFTAGQKSAFMLMAMNGVWANLATGNGAVAA